MTVWDRSLSDALAAAIIGLQPFVEVVQMPARLRVPEKAIADFCRRNCIRKLSLFGSVLRDDFGADSDVDVLLEFLPGEGVGYIGLAGLQDELTDLLGREVDLNTRNGLHRRFRDTVLAEAEVVYSG